MDPTSESLHMDIYHGITAESKELKKAHWVAELKRVGHKVHKYLQRLYFLSQFFPLLAHNYLPYLERFHLAYLIR